MDRRNILQFSKDWLFLIKICRSTNDKRSQTDPQIIEIFQSCREALREYPGSNLYYWIQQEGLSTAVYAKCVKETDGSYYALIDHDSESRRKVDGYDAKASYIRQFKYLTNAFEDIVEFVNASSSCRQHTKLECYNMRIIYQNWGYIMDRDGKKLNYLGGGPSNGVGCACGISGTCRDNAFKCNCDANLAGVWLKDEGYVMDKNVLPLTEIRLGDTGASTEVGYHTIGKLECTEHFNSCKDALQDYPSGGLYHWIKHKGMENAVKVKCIKKSDGKIWAQFDHDTENRAYISGFEACHSYKKEFKYGKVNTMTDIIAFIETSSSCKQFTKAECKGIQFISRNCAYLQGRNGKQLSYFGGGPANGVGCKCGIDGACINAAYKCNCDSNSGLTSDEGYVRKKEDLPLNGIALGDTGASAEYAYHTIGKLECLE